MPLTGKDAPGHPKILKDSAKVKPWNEITFRFCKSCCCLRVTTNITQLFEKIQIFQITAKHYSILPICGAAHSIRFTFNMQHVVHRTKKSWALIQKLSHSCLKFFVEFFGACHSNLLIVLLNMWLVSKTKPGELNCKNVTLQTCRVMLNHA